MIQSELHEQKCKSDQTSHNDNTDRCQRLRGKGLGIRIYVIQGKKSLQSRLN